MSQPPQCRAFANTGQCRFGSRCKFVHERASSSAEASAETGRSATSQRANASRARALNIPNNNASQASIGPRSSVKRGEVPCKAWRSGNCTKGDRCFFGHDQQVQEQARLRREQVAQEEARRVAAQLEAGRRAQAETERQRELEAAQRAQQRERDAEQRARQQQMEIERARQRELEATQRARQRELDAAFTLQHIVFGASVVTFAAGIDMQDVITGFEACRIRIQNLPRTAKPDEIKQLFTQQGIDAKRLFIASTRLTPDGHKDVTLVTTSEEGGIVAIGLEDIEFGDERLHFEVMESYKEGGMGSFGTNNASNTLTMTWPAPSTSAIVTFVTAEQARAKAGFLNRGVCEGRRVRAEMNNPPRASINVAREVKISRLPVGVSAIQVQEFCGGMVSKFLRPLSYDVEAGIAALRQDVERKEAPEVFNVVTREGLEGNVVVKARFPNWETAKRVQDFVSGLRPVYMGQCSIRGHLPDPLQYVLAIPTAQFQAQERSWNSLDGIRVTHMNTHVRIRVVGGDKTVLGKLKVRVEKLAAGENLGPACWNDTFRSKAGSDFLSSLHSRTGAYTRADWRISAVKVYGDAAAAANAREAVEEEIRRLNSLERTFYIERRSVRFFVVRGLDALREEVGANNARLVVTGRPQIVIRGGDDAIQLFHRLAEESKSGVQLVATGSSCPVCFDEVSLPVELGCGHVYCTGCLRHWLSAADDAFPLACLGNDANCGIPIPIPTIQQFLSAPQFAGMLETAFRRYMEQRPQEFRYCKTPDCEQIYRQSTRGASKPMTCPSCFVQICTACHEEGHVGITCEDRRLQNDTGEQERRNELWADENGVKRCPRCSVWIEKTEGCNHMTCHCGAHICWICLRVFDTGALVYDHLTAAHGGLFDVPPEIQRAPVFLAPPPVMAPPVRNWPAQAPIAGGAGFFIEQAEREREAALLLAQEREQARERQRRAQELLVEEARAHRERRQRETQGVYREFVVRPAASAAPRQRDKRWCVLM